MLASDTRVLASGLNTCNRKKKKLRLICQAYFLFGVMPFCSLPIVWEVEDRGYSAIFDITILLNIDDYDDDDDSACL